MSSEQERTSEPPQIEDAADWLRVCTHAIGGLTEVGLAGSDRYLLVVSHAGRGVIDLASGRRVARDEATPASESPWLNRAERQVQGIGPIAAQWIPMIGLWGGQLASSAPGWRVRLAPAGHRALAIVVNERTGAELLADRVTTEVRAFGFSDVAHFLVLASASEVSVWTHLAS